MTFKVSLITCLVLFAKVQCEDTVKWSYYGPLGLTKWSDEFKNCNGSRQSPIDIRTDETSRERPFDDIEYIKYDRVPAYYVIENNGETVVMSTDGVDPEVDIVIGKETKYKFLQLHFHWGSRNTQGSEHTINGKRYPMEMHLVHADVGHHDPLGRTDGLAVLSVLFEIGEHNTNIQPIVDALYMVRHNGNTTSVMPFALGSILPKDKSIWRYMGSLTTPPCSEAVVWSIFKNHVTVSVEQLEHFRSLKDHFGRPMVDNFRPTQELNDRVITQSEYSPSDPNSANSFSDHRYQTVFQFVFTMIVLLHIEF